MPKTLRVLMVEPHESPHEMFITDQLDDLQETVGGLIEIIGNGDGTLLVCNDEAKLNGMDGNRRLNGDVIAGPFFVVGEDGENFRSLTDEEMQKYKAAFARQIFKHDLMQVYIEQTNQRNALVQQSRDVLSDIISRINSGSYDNPIVTDLLVKLSEQMKNYKGKKVYGYLPQAGRNNCQAWYQKCLY